jgi:putative transposase
MPRLSNSLLTGLRDQGLPTDSKYLFIIDGSKALRTGIEEVFGSDQEVRRCRNHKIENVMNELPKEHQEQTRKLMRAAFKLSSAEGGEKRLEQIARQLAHDYSSAARSLREGMKEMFTLQRLKIPASLHKCLATTNLIESPHSGVRRRTHNVCRWRDVDMVERWVASAWLLTEKHFQRIDGHQELWALAAILGREISTAKKKQIA